MDNRPTAVAQRELTEMLNNSPRVLQRRALSDAIQNSPRMVARRDEMNALFGGAVRSQGHGAMPAGLSPAQREEKPDMQAMPIQFADHRSSAEIASEMGQAMAASQSSEEAPAASSSKFPSVAELKKMLHPKRMEYLTKILEQNLAFAVARLIQNRGPGAKLDSLIEEAQKEIDDKNNTKAPIGNKAVVRGPAKTAAASSSSASSPSVTSIAKYEFDPHGQKHFGGSGTSFTKTTGKTEKILPQKEVNDDIVKKLKGLEGRILADAKSDAPDAESYSKTYYLTCPTAKFIDCDADEMTVQIDYVYKNGEHIITYHGYPDKHLIKHTLSRTKGGAEI